MEVNTGTAVAAGAISLALSERVRDTLRKGVVYGIAGVISAGDAAVGVARGAVEDAQAVRSNGRGSGRKTATAKS